MIISSFDTPPERNSKNRSFCIIEALPSPVEGNLRRQVSAAARLSKERSVE